MAWLSRLFGKSRRDRAAEPSRRPYPEPSVQPATSADPPPLSETPVEPKPDPGFPPPPHHGAEPAASDAPAPDEDEAEDREEADASDGMDEADPTIGRYEPLDEAVLGAQAVQDLRIRAEAQALSGPHKVWAWDAAGPGSVAEALVRLEGEGRVTSEVCDDPEAGFYILYRPVILSGEGGARSG